MEPRAHGAARLGVLTDTGRADEAVPLMRGALENNRNSAEAHWELGYAYRFGGLLSESIAECERTREIAPAVKSTSSALNTYLYIGNYDKFLSSLPPNGNAYLTFYRGFAEYYKHDTQHAMTDFDRAYQMDAGMLPAQVGKGIADAIRQIGVSEVTYYRWRQEYGGLKADQVKRLKQLEQENSRLRRAVSDLTLDKLILQEAARGNF